MNKTLGLMSHYSSMGTRFRQADTLVERNPPGFLRLRLTSQSESTTRDLNSDSASAFPNWTETPGLHGESDGIAKAAAYWSRGLSVVLYKQAVRRTCSPMLCVKCTLRLLWSGRDRTLTPKERIGC